MAAGRLLCRLWPPGRLAGSSARICGGGPRGRFVQAARFCSASAAIARASAPPGPWTRSTAVSWPPGTACLSRCCLVCPPVQPADKAWL